MRVRPKELCVAVTVAFILTWSLLGCSEKETLQSQPNSNPNNAQSLIVLGNHIFHNEGCGNCHAIGGIGGLAGKALKTPDLANVGNRMDRETIENAIIHPESGSSMPAFEASDEDVRALITYLESL